MAKRYYAKLPQICIGQGPQHFPVDIVLLKRGLVLFEPETAQPGRNIHLTLHRVRRVLLVT